jgi:uncharacterized membrane protein YebE (DUF533 family)
LPRRAAESLTSAVEHRLAVFRPSLQCRHSLPISPEARNFCASRDPEALMLDPKKLLNDLLGSQLPGSGGSVRDGATKVQQMAKDNPLATGALVAVLLGTRTGRNLAGTAIKLGGLAAIGSVAYNAYKNYRDGNNPAQTTEKQPELLPPPADTDFHPSQAPQGEAEFALTLVRAMIAAANADGHIDETERKRIADKLSLAGVGAEAEAFLLKEIQNPWSIDQLVAAAQTEAQRVELYTASRLTIEPDTRTERGYLDLLAGRLNLPDALIDHVEATIVSATTIQTGSAGPADATPSGPAPTSVPNVNPRW